MSRFAKTETALIERLRTMKATPEMSISLSDLSTPLLAAGFSREEFGAVLDALEQDKMVAYVPGNRLLILNKLPD